MTQGTQSSAVVLPFPREAVCRSWKVGRPSQRKTTAEAMQGELIQLAMLVDVTLGHIGELENVLHLILERADIAHRKLMGVGVKEVANCPRLAGLQHRTEARALIRAGHLIDVLPKEIGEALLDLAYPRTKEGGPQ